jgi:uncharacterized protein (DUF58 family)
VNARVRFASSFMGRLGRLVGRLRALSARREGVGAARLAGGGEEFVGHRPWRDGEDARLIDWNLFARFDQPFVRVFEREAAESWLVMLDTSASMDVGAEAGTSKLQLAAEVVMGLAALAAESGARLTLWTSCGQSFVLRRARDQRALRRKLEGLGTPHEGLELGLGQLAEQARLTPRTGRVIVIGDLFDLEPRDVLELGAPGRELVVIRVLSSGELAPTRVFFAEGAARLELEEVETEARLIVDFDAARHYERELEEELEAWHVILGRHRVLFTLADAGTTPFEEALAPLVDGMGA